MRVSERFHEAAAKILAGDDSIVAAQALEGVLLDEYFDDARSDELLYTFRSTPRARVRHTLMPKNFAR